MSLCNSMMRPLAPFLLTVVIAALLNQRSIASPEDGDDLFEKEIRPILADHCFQCHSATKQEAGLRLDTAEAAFRGGDSGPALVPNKPSESLLIQAISYQGDLRMPPRQKLSDTQITRITEWIASGAHWPANSLPAPAGKASSFQITEAQKHWWAFQPLQQPIPPHRDGSSWALNEIDEFIESELYAHGLQPSPPIERRLWLRRAHYDLTGLPPTIDEFNAFLADTSSNAFEHAVKRLLDSPAYGQRWARPWLDVARYADYHDGDPKARDINCEPMQAWRYRDWVVDSFNRDMPWDQFIQHQIAGDLLPVTDGKEFNADGLIATTFLTNGTWDRGDADKEKMVSDMVDDNIDTVGKAFLGLTLGCARCHNHKFDPISQDDYYALAGIFYSTRILQDLGAKGANYFLHRVPLVDASYLKQREEQLKHLNQLKSRIEQIDQKSGKTSDEEAERARLIAERDQFQLTLLPEPPMAESAMEGGTPGGLFPGIQDVPVHIRGSYTRLGHVVQRRMPSFFAGDQQPIISTGSGRRELAAWVSSPDNPLTARVIVNRIWQGHFGTGLVTTPNNFGMQSEPPVHQKLLDWLACQLIAENWSIKKLHRRILLSATWRQGSSRQTRSDTTSSDSSAPATITAADIADPENRLFGRMIPRRLEAEAIRDSMLQASGQLDLTPGGPATDDLNTKRRSLYVQTARWDRSGFAALFDAANPDASDEKRNVTTVAPQSLFLMNHPFVLNQATQLVERLNADVLRTESANAVTPMNTAQKIDHLFELLFQRPADANEHRTAGLILGQADPHTAWQDLAHVLLCSNEFVYID